MTSQVERLLSCNCKEQLEKKIKGTAFNDNFLIQNRFNMIMVLKLLEKQSQENEFYVPFEGTNYDCTHLYELAVIGLEVYTFKEMYEMIAIVEEHSKHG